MASELDRDYGNTRKRHRLPEVVSSDSHGKLRLVFRDERVSEEEFEMPDETQ